MKTDSEVKKLLVEHAKYGSIEKAGLKMDMSWNTASKYIKAWKLPSELKEPRTWRTREDPFEVDWPEVEEKLKSVPEFQAKTLFDDLLRRKPEDYHEGQLRTFQRRVREWRAKEGPAKEVFFAQDHRPGEAMQLDFCSGLELGITIGDEPYPHLLCHSVLPYSNWEYACSCQSESMLAIRRGLQQALRKLQHVPDYLQTDNTTAATHTPAGEEDSEKRRRPFNEEYEELVRHFGMKPRTIAVGKSEQNGDVEALHRGLKNRLEQRLLLRGRRDFESVEAYEFWLEEVYEEANRYREKKVAEELRQMRPLQAKLLPEYNELTAPVKSGSTINIMRNTYSVPSRLKGEKVKVRVYENRLEVSYKDIHQFTVERLTGRGNAKINYRHIIASLVRKPGAFARYRYRTQLFPTFIFRRAYDALCSRFVSYRADLEYLRILKLAADTMEAEVEAALELVLEERVDFDADTVRDLVKQEVLRIPELSSYEVSLEEYDALLESKSDFVEAKSEKMEDAA